MAVHKLTIRNRSDRQGAISTGANTEVLLDGQPMKGVSSVKIECKALDVTKVTIEMYAEVDAEVYSKLRKRAKGRSDLKTLDGSRIAQFQVGSLKPAKIHDEENEEG
jgi:hypothetical protein